MRRQVRRKEEGRVAERKEAGYSKEGGRGQGRVWRQKVFKTTKDIEKKSKKQRGRQADKQIGRQADQQRGRQTDM